MSKSRAVLGILLGSVVAGVILGLMMLPFVGGAGVLARDVVREFESLPDSLSTPPLPERTVILASDGSVLATLYYQNRIEVPFDSISPQMRQAAVAIEDSRFLDHNGVDVRGIVRALARNTSSGEIEQGASTITMQYVKNVLVNQATTPEELEAARGDNSARKIREVRYAIALEKQFNKEEILSRYLNIAYFGSGAYGVEAAARRYFSTSAADLNLVQAATLAGIVKQPTAYDPLRNPELSQKRRNIVLNRMAELGYITQEQADRATQIPVESTLKPTQARNGCTSSYAPFFCDYVVQTIRTDPVFGATPEEREAFLRRGGYTIRTTLDARAQQSATEVVNSYIPFDDPSRKAAAISIVEPGTGAVKVMTQNREWGTSGIGKTTYNYNVGRDMGGTQGMQAGSAFKIFTLAAALEAGVSPFEYIPSPSPATFLNFVNCETGAQYPPVTVRNSTTSGTLNMAQATAYSTNTYFMAIEERTGICPVAELAEELGVTRGNGEPLDRVPSLTLGSVEVTPLAMATAYAAFAAHGEYCKPIVMLDIVNRDGDSLPVPSANCRQVVPRPVADTVTELLVGVVDGNISGRTGARMSLSPQPAAGKTGTTNESAAVWFAGYTPQLAAAVWVGDPRGGFAYPMKDVTINGTYYNQVFGGTLPGPIWRDSMKAALAGQPPLAFSLETGIGGSVATLPKIPNLVGLTVEQAEERLFAENYELGGVTEIDAPAPAGEIVGQSPAAGMRMAPGTQVSISISTGTSSVPSVVDILESDAIALLAASGYPTDVIRQAAPGVPTGTVLAQSIPATTPLAVGTTVQITVADSGEAGDTFDNQNPAPIGDSVPQDANLVP